MIVVSEQITDDDDDDDDCNFFALHFKTIWTY